VRAKITNTEEIAGNKMILGQGIQKKTLLVDSKSGVQQSQKTPK
jgi:hypothetical protein